MSTPDIKKSLTRRRRRRRPHGPGRNDEETPRVRAREHADYLKYGEGPELRKLGSMRAGPSMKRKADVRGRRPRDDGCPTGVALVIVRGPRRPALVRPPMLRASCRRRRPSDASGSEFCRTTWRFLRLIIESCFGETSKLSQKQHPCSLFPKTNCLRFCLILYCTLSLAHRAGRTTTHCFGRMHHHN